MKRRWAFCWTCGLALVMLLTAAAGGETPTFKRFLSDHYLIHTDMPREEVVPFGRHMDAVFDQYQRRFSGFPIRDVGPMPLYLFREREDYVAYLDRHGIDATNSGGMFFLRPQAQGLATWTNGHSRSETFATLQHEGFHQFAWARIGRQLPVWINEGLAQYFEDAILVDDRMTTGLANARRIETVKAAHARGELIPLSELLATKEADWARTLTEDPSRASLLYAESWSVVYYLVHGRGGRLQQPFEAYLRLVSRGRASADAFEEAFGISDASPVEAQWLRFAAHHEPDPLNTAAARLEFLAVALRFLHERGETPPRSIDELRDNLQARRFSVTRTSHGLVTVYRAADADLYRYERDNGMAAPFQVLAAAMSTLPPRIQAAGLTPTPTLVWRRDSEGQLVQDIEYR